VFCPQEERYKLIRKLTNELWVIIGIVVLWYALYQLNSAIFKHADINDYVAWVFLPAILRLVCVLLFGMIGVVGLFIGSFVTLLNLTDDLLDLTLISLASSFSPYLAVLLCKKLLKIPYNLTDLSAINLLVMTFIAAVFSSGIHSLYFWYANSPIYFTQMFIGDLIGSFLGLYTLKYFLNRLVFAKNSNLD
jgi:hypothetical protein